MLAKKILQTGFVQTVSLGIGVIAGIFITRLLGPEGRGIYAIYKANTEFLLLLLAFGMGSVVTYYVSSEQISVKKIFGIALLSFVVGILGATSLLLVVPYTPIKSFFFPEQYDGLFFQFYVYFSFILGFVGTVLSGFLNGKKYFLGTNLAKVVYSTGLLITIILFYFYFSSEVVKTNTKSVFLISLVLSAINVLLLFCIFFRKFREDLGVSLHIGKELRVTIGFIYLVYIGEVINFFNYRLDIWLVEYYTDAYQLGLYSLAVSVSQLLWLIAIPITLVLLPYLNAVDKNTQAKEMFFFTQKLLLR